MVGEKSTDPDRTARRRGDTRDWQGRAPGSKDPRKELTRRKSLEREGGQQEEKDQ